MSQLAVAHHLPDAGQVGLAVGRPRQRAGGAGSRSGDCPCGAAPRRRQPPAARDQHQRTNQASRHVSHLLESGRVLRLRAAVAAQEEVAAVREA